MRESLKDKLRCPTDLSPLSLDVSLQASDGHVISGYLHCVTCEHVYPVDGGVPNLTPAASIQINGSNLSRLQAATVQRFGFEWLYFRDWGWLRDYPDFPGAKERFYGGLLEHTRSAFWSKSLFREEDLKPGLSVLDAGCGNGRFTWMAAQRGAEVIGIDLGPGVKSAFEHTREMSNVHIIRGDLFRLPFKDKTFHRIFSIGVLQHTGNAKTAFDSLVRVLRPGGLIVAHVYGRGRLTYEAIDALVRAVTTRFSIHMQLKFARITAAMTRWMKARRQGGKLYRHLFSHINLLPTETHMYDWWAAPIATHHTENEVRGWFAGNGLHVVRSNPPAEDIHAQWARRRWHGAITVLGRLPVSQRG